MAEDGLISADELRELFAIDPSIVDARFARALKAGSRRLREWVGDEAYDDAASADPDDDQRKEDLAYAEAHLAMGYAILGVNTSLRQSGIVRTEKLSEGATVVQYHSPQELEKLQTLYFQTAQQVAGPYLLNDGTVDAFAAVTTSEDAEAATRPRRCC